ncbi:MarR family winged helix-turn-helix transcriptional regulator [Paraburkholderia tropica]|uniref:MarR family winged helix-turn-helix transcriptional regulator n=1 Tax=Paraburkholderia tropica TaxID=92647 RepID=UPI002AB61E9A|nr:MarR family transcriptional regulator [Paraburkholderia tropica]
MHAKVETAGGVPDKEELLARAKSRDVIRFIDAALEVSMTQLPEINSAATRLILSIFRISEDLKYDLAVTVQRPANLSSPGFHLLWVTWLTGKIEAKTVATLMGVSRATVSGISATLEKAGFITRTPSLVDRRSVNIDLTPEGHELFERVFDAANSRYLSLFNDFTVAEIETLVALLGKLSSGSAEVTRQRH